MKKLFRLITLLQVGYYTYDWIANKRSFKDEFVPNFKRIARKVKK